MHKFIQFSVPTTSPWCDSPARHSWMTASTRCVCPTMTSQSVHTRTATQPDGAWRTETQVIIIRASCEPNVGDLHGCFLLLSFWFFLFRRSGNWSSRSQDDLDRRQWMPERLVEPRRGTSLFRLQQSVHHSLSGELLVSKAINYELITIVSWLATSLFVVITLW